MSQVTRDASPSTVGPDIPGMTRAASEFENVTSQERSSLQTEVPGYVLQEEIGRGGMGVVYRARDIAFDRNVAIKVLLSHFPTHGTQSRRFFEEARITGQLQHPGIPAVHAVGLTPGHRPFLAMKLINGASLTKLLTGSAPINVLAIFEQIAQAVGYAHAHGVIHRDLKPANVMVGAFGEVQVMDWGLAKHMMCPVNFDADSATERASLVNIDRDDTEATQSGHALGTSAFMSPEQALGAVDQIDTRSDVFGLGAVLCCMLTGKPPFHAANWEASLEMAARGDLSEASARLDQCSAEPELVALCRQCLSVKREDRPADGGAVAECVAKLRAATEERARQAEADRVKAEVLAAEQRKRRRVATIAASAVVAACLIGGIIALGQYRQKSTAFDLLTTEQTRTQDALTQVTQEQSRTKAALDQVTKEQQQLRIERRNTVAALNVMTDDVIQRLFARQQKFSATEQEFLKNVIELYQQATVNCSDSTTGQALKAEGYFRVALLQFKLGALKDAEENFLRAGGILKSLVSEQPAERVHRDALAGTLASLGTLYLNTSRAALAEEQFLESIKLRIARKEEGPVEAREDNNQAIVHNNLGVLYRDQRRMKEAEVQYLRCVELRREILAKQPNYPEVIHSLAMSLDNLANLFGDTQREPEAIPVYLESQGLLANLAVKHPENPQFAFGVGSNHNNLGVLYRDIGRTAEAEKEFSAANSVLQKLVEHYPVVTQYKVVYARTINNVVKVLMARGQFAEAEPLTVKSELLLREALKVEPLNRDFRKTFFSNRTSYIKCQLGLRKPQAVRAAVREMLDYAYRPKSENQYDAACFLAVAAGLTLQSEERNSLLQEAMDHFRTALASGYADVNNLRKDPELDTLRSMPEFQKLLAELELKHPTKELAPFPAGEPGALATGEL